MSIEKEIKETTLAVSLPVLPLRGLVLFPGMMLHFDVGRKKSALAIDYAMKKDQTIFITSQKDISVNDPSYDDVYKVGVIAKIVQVLRQSDSLMRVVVEGLERAELASVSEVKKRFLYAQILPLNVPVEKETMKTKALVRSLKGVFEQYVRLTPHVADDILYKISINEDAATLCDFISGNISLEYQRKQDLLENLDLTSRLEKLIDYITYEVYILEIEDGINQKARERIDENQREYYLREQLRAIEDELGEGDEFSKEADEYREKIKSLSLPEDSEKALLKECDRLSKTPYGAQEANVIRTYLDNIIELPWNTSTEERIDIDKVKKELDRHHYGLTKVKERILELLAVRKLSPNVKGQIICLVGPPGVGKTSIAQAIAGAINRKSARIALGGVRDESEIRGHRRTYIGAMPGRIMAAVKIAGTNNPLIILDEIDKLGNDYKGDPTSALLEVLDAEQNNTFHDHYIDVPFDLSNVLFITTANDYNAIPAPLLDRMDVITLDSYTREEKFHIAKKHLLTKQMKNCGIERKSFRLTDAGIYELIDYYTREAGVRNLERAISSLLRKAALKFVSGEESKITVSARNAEDFLGPRKFKRDNSSKEGQIGVVNGLAWTSVGGETLPVEVAVVPGSGKLELTGNLGNVMKESAKAALTCVRGYSDKLGIKPDFYKKYDIHIHAPEGAIPKDGPSAGITIATALVSALTGVPVKGGLAMTGEITLRGSVLAIGGLKEKSMAAYRLGVKTVIIPQSNLPDLFEVDNAVKAEVEFKPVESFSEVLKIAFDGAFSKTTKKQSPAYTRKKGEIKTIDETVHTISP